MKNKKRLLAALKKLNRDAGIGRVARKLEAPAAKLAMKAEHVAMIADFQLNQGDTAAAIRTLQTGLDRFSDSALLGYKLAFAFERSKAYEEAHQLFFAIADREDGAVQSFYRLAKIDEARGLQEDALAWAVVYTGLVPGDLRGHELAYRLSKGQPVWRRLEILQAGLDHVAVNDTWIADCITLNYQMRRYNRCLLIVSAYPDRVNGKAFARAIASYVQNGDVRQARTVAREYALARNRKDIDTFPGDQLKSLGNWGGAAKLYALEFEMTGSLNAARGAGFALAREFKWAESSAWYYSSLLGSPKDERTHYDLGVALEKQGKYSDAARHYLNAVTKLAPSNYRFYRAVYCLDRAGDTAGAAVLLASVLEPSPQQYDDTVESLFEGANLEGVLCVAKSNQSIGALRYVTKLAVKTRQWELSLRAGHDLIARSGNHSPDLYFLVAKAQLELDMSAEAVQTFLASRIHRQASIIDPATYEKLHFNRMNMRYSAFREEVPIDDEAVLYESNQGAKVTCNILPLLERASTDVEFNNWKHYVVAPHRGYLPESIRFRDNIIVVKKQSELYLRILASAKYLISNNTFPAYFSRRAEQRYLNTWHGTPIKSMGKDIKNGTYDHKNASRNLLHCTHLALPNAHTSVQMLERYDIAHIFPGQLMLTGSPRLDRSFGLSALRRREIRAELGASELSRIVLFAPTWRGELGNVHSSDSYLDDVAEAASQNGWMPVYRGHPITSSGDIASQASFTVVPDEIDTNDLLGAVDAVISDYSSISIDAASVGLPVLLYTPDFAVYEAERGFSVDISDLGIATAREPEELHCWLSEAQPDNSRWSDPLELAKYEDGHATDRVIDFFLRSQSSPERSRKGAAPSVLLFEGHCIPNGITAAAREANKVMVAAGANVTLAIEPTAIAGDELRSRELEVAAVDCAVLPRVIGSLDNAEERWVVLRQHNGFDLTEEHERVIGGSYEREFERLYGAAHFDTVVGFEGFSLYWANLMAYSSKERRIGFIHADMEKEAINRFSHLWNLFPIYAKYDRLVSVSPDALEVNRRTLSRWIEPSKFTLVENMIDQQRISRLAESALPAELDRFIEAHERTFVSVGRLSIEKGGDRLIDAFLQVCDSRSDVGLVIVGDGIMRAELERRVYAKGHEEHVYFVGFDENPYKVIAACDCLVLASRHEGQGIVLLEALSLKTRVIATDIPGPRSILANAPSMLVEDSSEGIYRGMASVLSDDGQLVLPPIDDYVDRARGQLLGAVGIELPEGTRAGK